MSESWDYRLIDDVRNHPEYAVGPGWAAGMRSMLFVPIRFEGRHYGGLNFYSRTPGRYLHDDLLIARRVTDHVALALSHRRLAEQIRRNEELRARAAQTELLDALLAPLIDSGDLREGFNRISTIAGKVLPHDAAALMVLLPGGRQARVYAGAGVPAAFPEITDVPQTLLQRPDWEHEILDDLSVGRPFPHVANDVVESVAVRRERADWGRTLVAVSRFVLPRKCALPVFAM